jgi:hypothetical protein
VNWNVPKSLYDVAFIRGDEKTLNIKQKHNYGMWDNAFPSYDYDEKNKESETAATGDCIKQFDSIQEHI